MSEYELIVVIILSIKLVVDLVNMMIKLADKFSQRK